MLETRLGWAFGRVLTIRGAREGFKRYVPNCSHPGFATLHTCAQLSQRKYTT
jgi:hypothetical protein